MTVFDLLIRMADRLGKAGVGSPSADYAIHDTLACEGPVLADTSEETAARLLLRARFKWKEHTYSARLVYATSGEAGGMTTASGSHTTDNGQHPGAGHVRPCERGGAGERMTR